MIIKDCMTKNVELANPNMSLKEAAQKMKDGDFGALPVGENDRLIGMVTDRDIAIRAVAEGKDSSTPVREIISKKLLYCYDDQDTRDVVKNMGDNGVRRLPVLNREKRLVGIVSLGDVAVPKKEWIHAGEALSQISQRKDQQAQMPN
jgi:CBS domain-containing protein